MEKYINGELFGKLVVQLGLRTARVISYYSHDQVRWELLENQTRVPFDALEQTIEVVSKRLEQKVKIAPVDPRKMLIDKGFHKTRP